MEKITPFLWFNDNAEEAMNYYISVFKNGKITYSMRNGDAGPGPKGSLLTGTFEINGQEFMVINGGPTFKLTEAISLFITCSSQEEVDELWEKLSEGGEKSQCGWLKDKFGLSWQVVPPGMMEVMNNPDPEKAKRAMQAMMKMTKLDINVLRAAVEGK